MKCATCEWPISSFGPSQCFCAKTNEDKEGNPQLHSNPFVPITDEEWFQLAEGTIVTAFSRKIPVEVWTLLVPNMITQNSRVAECLKASWCVRGHKEAIVSPSHFGVQYEYNCWVLGDHCA